MKEKTIKRKEQGITLIALVITIIVLLILAGVSIAMLTGQNGILTQAQRASEQTDIGNEKEQISLAYNGAVLKKAEEGGGDVTATDLNDQFDLNGVTDAEATGSNPITVTFDSGNQYTIDENGNITGPTTGTTPPTTGGTLGTVTGTETSNTTVQDSLGNQVIVPAGFVVGNPNDNVEDGIYIVDSDNTRATYGSEFVWIPVGTIHTSSGDKTITLGRYVFNSDGSINEELSKTEPTDQLKTSSTNSDYYTEGLKDSSTTNTHAKDIATFISKVNNETHGYYIGRYEARTGTPRSNKNDALTQITVKPDDYVYNWVTQPQAASLSQGMYSDSNFESDLVNSYAWDTAIDFLQKCDDREEENLKPYSQQNSSNTGSVASKGTNGTGTEDVICNVYDMASNCREWTTEMNSFAITPCVLRGAVYYGSDLYAATRGSLGTSFGFGYSAFRPLLYL